MTKSSLNWLTKRLIFFLKPPKNNRWAMFFPYCHFRSASIHYPTFPVIVRLDWAIPSSCHYPADFITVIIHPFLLMSLSGILFLCHYPAWPDNPHRKASFSPSSVISPPGAAGRGISNSDCPIKSGNDTKGIKPDKDNKGSKSDNNAKESQ